METAQRSIEAVVLQKASVQYIRADRFK
jgi:hypothetical protein